MRFRTPHPDKRTTQSVWSLFDHVRPGIRVFHWGSRDSSIAVSFWSFEEVFTQSPTRRTFRGGAPQIQVLSGHSSSLAAQFSVRKAVIASDNGAKLRETIPNSNLRCSTSKFRGLPGIPERDSGGCLPGHRNGRPSNSILPVSDCGRSASGASAECRLVCQRRSD